jgi:hypothetical protein
MTCLDNKNKKNCVRGKKPKTFKSKNNFFGDEGRRISSSVLGRRISSSVLPKPILYP